MDADLHQPWMVEEATLEDVPQLCELLSELFTRESDFEAAPEKQAAGLCLLLEAPEWGRIYVVRQQEIIVGMVNLLTTISPQHGGNALLLEDLIVREPYRGQGVASALLRRAKAVAAANDSWPITLLTDHSNESAIRLYERSGFVKLPLTPMRRVEG